MAPALTQTAEPPDLTDTTTCHTPPESLPEIPSPYESLKEFSEDKINSGVTTKSFFEFKKSCLSNGDCVPSGLAPPAFGWAVGRPVPSSTSPCRFNMDELPPLPLDDSGNMCILTGSSSIDNNNSEQQTTPQELDVSRSNSSTMGIQSCLTNVDTASAPIEHKRGETAALTALAPGSLPLEDSSPMLSHQNELLGRDFDYVTDIIETLQRLLELEPEAGSVTNASPPQSPEERAASMLERLSDRQRVLERRRLFLLRRLRRVTARGLGMTVSSQLSHLTRHVRRVLEEERKKRQEREAGETAGTKPEEEPILSLEMLHKESMKSMSTSDLISLVRRVEASHNNNHLQRLSDTLTKKKREAKEVSSLPSTLCAELDTVASEVRAAACTHYSHDSDATESSSGGESCDEAEGYTTINNNSYKPIRERTLYRYCRRRGWIASRWMWLQAQIADLDHKILQQQKLHTHIQKNKGSVQLAENLLVKGRNPAHLDMQDPALTCIGSPSPRTILNGYHPSKLEDVNSPSLGYVNNSNSNPDGPRNCARTLGIEKVKRRRYVRPNVAMLNRSLGGSSNSTNKVNNKVSSVLCKCVPPLTCILCIRPRTSSKNKVINFGNHVVSAGRFGHKAFMNQCVSGKLARVDQAFHPVLSRPAEMLQGELYSMILKSYDWQQKALVSKPLPQKEECGTLSSASPFEPLAKRKKREKDHKRNGRRRHTKDEGSERLTQIQSKRNLTEDEADEGDDELSSLQVSVGGSAFSSPCPSPAGLPEKDAKALQLEARTSRKQSGTGRQKQNSTSNSYDINNIVIPCSMAASSRVELLQYKEIPTPKWRIEEIAPLSSTNRSKKDLEEEDVSEETIISRHSRSEEMERKKFLQYLQTQVNSSRPSRSRRADSSGTNTPDHPLSPRPLELTETSTPIESPPDTPFPGPSEDSNPSSHTSTKSANQSTVLTLSLSSLQSSLLKSNYPPTTNDSDAKSVLTSSGNSEENNGSSCINISSLRSQRNSAPSNCVAEFSPALRTRRMLSCSGNTLSERVRLPSLGDDTTERGRVSPFPCRHFPLNESEFEDMVVCENECNHNPTSSQHVLTRSNLKNQSTACAPSTNFPPHSGTGAEVVETPIETDVESGRDSPLSELTDSAPEEEGSWEDGAAADWTISAVSDSCGELVLTVQRN